MKENETLIAELLELGLREEHVPELDESMLCHKVSDILSRYPDVNTKRAIINVVNINYNFSQSNQKMRACVRNISNGERNSCLCSECTDINKKICMHKGPLFTVVDVMPLYQWCRGAVLNETGKELFKEYIPLYRTLEEQDFFELLLNDIWETGLYDILREDAFREIYEALFGEITKPIHTEVMKILEKYDEKYCKAVKNMDEDDGEDEGNIIYWENQRDEALQTAGESFWITFFDKGKHTIWMFDVMFYIHGWNGIHADIQELIEEDVDAFRD